MADEVQETTEQGFLTNLQESCKSVGIGILITLGCVGFLFFNEWNFASEGNSLKEGKKITVDLPSADIINPSFNGKLVHVSGFAGTQSKIQDDLFGINIGDTLEFKRSVEMYQWVETSSTKTTKKTGGSSTSTTTYSYNMKWEGSPVKSSTFKNQSGHENPSFPFENSKVIATNVKLGAFSLSDNVLSKIYDFQALSSQPDISAIPDSTKAMKNNSIIAPYMADNNFTGFYIGKGDVNNPALGDVKVVFSRVPTQVITIIGNQTGGSFDEYTTKNGRDILLVSTGDKSIDEMFVQANKDLKKFTWMIRGICFFFIWVGLSLIADPLVSFLDVLPLLGDCFQGVVYLVSFFVALCIWVVTVAIAWCFFRPLFSLCALAGVAVVAIGIKLLANSRKKKDYEQVPEVV